MISMCRLRNRIEWRQSSTVRAIHESTRPSAPGLLASCAALLLLAAEPSDPSRDAAPPASPPMTVPGGRMLFSDDFGADSLGRSWALDRNGVWSIRHGALRGDLPDRKQERSLITIAGSGWRDVRVDVDVCGMRGVDKGVVIRAAGNAGIAVDLRGPGYDDVVLHRGRHQLGKTTAINPNGRWHHLRIEAVGARYRVYVDDQLRIDREDGKRVVPGRIALPAYTGGVGVCTVYYDNVVVTALDSTAEDSR